MSDVIRNLLKLICLLLLLVVAVAGALFMTNMNYLGLVSLFELLNFETQTIGEDSLVGWLFQALAPGATFGHWFALAGAVVIFLGSLIVAHSLIKLLQLCFDRREYVRTLQRDLVAQANTVIARELVIFIAVGLLLGVVMYGDMMGLRYRGMVGLNYGLEDGHKAARTILAPAYRSEEETKLLSVDLLNNAVAWLYIALSLLAPMLLEIILMKMGDSFTRLSASVSALVGVSPPVQAAGGPQLYGYDSAGQPVTDPDLPITYDIYQKPVGTAPPVAARDSAVQDSPSQAGSAAPPQAPVEPPQDAAYVDVIGAPGKKISLADAINNAAAYHVDKRSGHVWDLAYWRQLQTGHD